MDGLKRDSDEERMVRRIKDVVARGQCLAFLGSGMSPEFKRWNRFIEFLGQQCEADLLQKEGEDDISRYYRIAQESYEKDPDKYAQLLIAEYGKQPAIARMAWTYIFQIGFDGFLTTNFDRHLLIEGSKYNRGYYDHSRISFRHIVGNLGYIHGLIRANDVSVNIIFKKDDYDRHYSSEPGSLLNTLYQIFRDWDVIFIGYSLSDLALRELLKKLTINERITYKRDEVPEHLKRRRYIIQPYPFTKNDDEGPQKIDELDVAIREKDFEELGAEVIWYDPKDSNHIGLEDLLQACIPADVANPRPLSMYGSTNNDKPTVR